MTDERMVTVCDACWRASCWHGDLWCDESQGDTKELPVSKLRKLVLENPEHYSMEKVARVEGWSAETLKEMKERHGEQEAQRDKAHKEPGQ